MPENTSPARFIVLEGLDGAGTSTQTALLSAWLRQRGLSVLETHEPSDGPTGKLIREVLAGRVEMDSRSLALAFAADRIEHNEGEDGILPTLAQGTWVVSDRYVVSSLAYQGSDGLPREWLLEINRFALTPDVTLFLDTSPETCARRVFARGGSTERFEGLERSRATLEAYEESFLLGRFVGHLIRASGEPPAEQVLSSLATSLDSWIAAQS